MLARSAVPWAPSQQLVAPLEGCDDGMPPKCDDCMPYALQMALEASVDAMPPPTPQAYKMGANPLDRMNSGYTREEKAKNDKGMEPAKAKPKKAGKKQDRAIVELGEDAPSHAGSNDSQECRNSKGETETWRLLVTQSWEELVKIEKGIGAQDVGKDSREEQERKDAAEGIAAALAAQKQRKKSKGGLLSWGRASSGDKDEKEQTNTTSSQVKDKGNGTTYDVPQTFEEMCILNANMIGVNVEFVKIVQQCFEKMVVAVQMNDDYRLELETNIMSLRFHKDVKSKFDPGSFKTVMLASLRSLLPKIWTIAHENAWTTMWEKIQGLLSDVMHLPSKYEKAVHLFMSDMRGDEANDFGIKAFNRLFDSHPQAESYFKASNARLNFLAGKSLEMATQMYQEPTRVTTETMGLGLRHIMYSVSVEYFEHLVNAIVEEVKTRTTDAVAVEGIQYSLTLIATIMVNTCNEGSNPLLRAIAANSGKDVKKSLAGMSRKQRNGEYL